MKNKRFQPLKKGLLLLSLGTSLACTRHGPSSFRSIPVVPGVSKSLADFRIAQLSQIGYDLHLILPARKDEPVQASEVISFHLKSTGQPVQLDFKESADKLRQVKVNQQAVPVEHTQEHLIIPAQYLKKGENRVEIDFIAGNLSLNRQQDFLYTLLVPDRARTVFPCFDQPSLKATFTLTLTIPEDWKAIANAPLQDSVLTAGQKTYRFQKSDLIPTYLFSFAAGKFDHLAQTANGRTMHFLHRETDKEKLAQSVAPIFQIHADALQFMEQYTGLKYPFQKFDFVSIPDFQYGGMEHVGAIQYKASTLFLDEGATQDQKISRSSLISHETAHMWFGDLVTMEWFNDVWMKEVFANFMADKITQVAVANSNYDLKFVVDHLPAAYGVDRTAGANPIRQQLDNLQDAGSMYGNIIYHKAPVMMRQLERLMGEEAFRKGLQQYLKQYAYGNATWPDLIKILDDLTPADLQAWNQVWVNEPGRPQFDYSLKFENNAISELTLRQKGEDGSTRFWPQSFEIALVYPNRIQELTVNMNQAEVTLPQAVGQEKPQFVLFDVTGQGYGVFPVDAQMLSGLYGLKNPVARASAYINLYENMQNGRSVSPQQLLDFYRSGLSRETEELNVKLITGQLSDIFWRFLPAAQRPVLAPQLEQELWTAMERATAGNVKKLLFKTYQSIALSAAAQNRLYQIWEKEQAPAGIKLSEDDYTSLALALAVRDYQNSPQILARQMARIPNPDRKKRLQFMLPALSGDAKERDAFFASLKKEENREVESWVLSALGYLHHPLRAATSEKYLKESLELLAEIQLTGDIFFPASWLSATFGSYQSAAAAATVRTFLEANPEYNPKLKGKILQAADGVFRAEKLVQQAK
ncbi:M1 family metallopeptidase [Rufibacter sediminis]|uniref:Aminopeptidase N n=1 Tax=Rufibacter sediminis TaxID=2762756 RepID=A0ABR6VUL2_9BACT|nr:M1 family aminopeptidase [Rufibacter sediminis]MBC3540890.1 aminopeptidase [Rufibacter sediminis]